MKVERTGTGSEASWKIFHDNNLYAKITKISAGLRLALADNTHVGTFQSVPEALGGCDVYITYVEKQGG